MRLLLRCYLPFALWIITALARLLNAGLGSFLHYVFVGLLSAAWLVQFAKWNLDITQAGLIIAIALVGSIAFVYTYLRWKPVNSLLQVAAIAPLITLGVFFLASDTGKIMSKVETQIVRSTADKQYPSVLFIIFDEFPTLTLFDEHGSIDKERFPNLNALAQQGTWYRHYSVLSDKTDLSIPSILTGNVPRPLRANMTNFPENLFSLLAPTHHLTVYETVTQLCELPQCGEGPPGAPIEKPQPDMRTLLSKTTALWLRRTAISDRGEVRRDDFTEQLASPIATLEKSSENALTKLMDPANQAKFASERPERLQKFIGTFVADKQSTLYFMHIELPHTPWRFYGSGKLYDLPFTIFPIPTDNSEGGEWMAKLDEYRFLQQAQYTDRLLGDMFSRMQALGIWDQLLVVVTADHGYSFQPHTSSRRIETVTINTIAYSPLLIKQPFQKAAGLTTAI